MFIVYRWESDYTCIIIYDNNNILYYTNGKSFQVCALLIGLIYNSIFPPPYVHTVSRRYAPINYAALILYYIVST